MAADFRNGAAGKGKIQHAHFPGILNINVKLFPNFPQNALQGRFPRFKLSAGAVHLARADSPLFAYQENPSFLHHEHQRGENIGGPLCGPLKAAAFFLHGRILQDGKGIMKKNAEYCDHHTCLKRVEFS